MAVGWRTWVRWVGSVARVWSWVIIQRGDSRGIGSLLYRRSEGRPKRLHQGGRMRRMPGGSLKTESAAIPFLEPRIAGREIFGEAFSSWCLKWSYWGQSRRMCSLVSVGLPQEHSCWPLREKHCLNSPVCPWPVRHCSVLPKSSRLLPWAVKWCVVGNSQSMQRGAASERLSLAPVDERLLCSTNFLLCFARHVQLSFVEIYGPKSSAARQVGSRLSYLDLLFHVFPLALIHIKSMNSLFLSGLSISSDSVYKEH